MDEDNRQVALNIQRLTNVDSLMPLQTVDDHFFSVLILGNL